jgi:hypothetical protein
MQLQAGIWLLAAMGIQEHKPAEQASTTSTPNVMCHTLGTIGSHAHTLQPKQY